MEKHTCESRLPHINGNVVIQRTYQGAKAPYTRVHERVFKQHVCAAVRVTAVNVVPTVFGCVVELPGLDGDVADEHVVAQRRVPAKKKKDQ